MLKDTIAKNAVRTRELNRPDPSRPLSRSNMLSQDEAAARVPMQTSHLSRIERGVQNATLDTLWRLEAAFGLKRYELFNENGGKEGEEPCYATLNRFARRCVKLPDDTPDTAPSPLLAVLDDMLIERIEVDDIEKAARGQ